MRRSRILVSVVVVLLGPLGVAFSQPARPTQDPVAGARLFHTKGCVACHAVNGVGGTEGPDLGHAGRPRSLYDLAARMWNHLPRMSQRIWALRTSRPYLTADEMSDLMAFVYGFEAPGQPRAADGEASSLGASGDRQRGERVVADKGCLECHALTRGQGNRTVGGSFDRWTGFDSPWIVVSTMWNHAFLMDVETRKQHRVWPRLSPAEIEDLAAFLARK